MEQSQGHKIKAAQAQPKKGLLFIFMAVDLYLVIWTVMMIFVRRYAQEQATN